MSGRVVDPEPCGVCGSEAGVRCYAGVWRCEDCRDELRDAMEGPL